MSGKESSASLSKSTRKRWANLRYTDEGGERGGAGRGGGVATDALPPRGGRRGGGRAGGRGGGRAGGRGGGRAGARGDIPSSSGDVASESRDEETESRDEETESRDVETGSGDEEAEDPTAPKKLKCRGESTVPDESEEPATEEKKTLIEPNGIDNWIHDEGIRRTPNSLLGALLRKYWPGFYYTVPNGERKLASRWVDYDTAPWVGYRSAADAVITRFWRFFRVLPEHRNVADTTLMGACKKLTRQQFYNAKNTAMNTFSSEKLGKRAPKHENVNNPPDMTVDDFMAVRPGWSDGREDAWAALASRWLGQDIEFKAVSDRNKANRGNDGTHSAGARGLTRYKKKMELELGAPTTDMKAWSKIKVKKPDLSKPQPSLPEYYGTAKNDLDRYCTAFTGFNPEVDDPLEQETDERALVVAGYGRPHGRYLCVDSVTPHTPELTLTRVKATLTVDGPAIPPPRRPSRARHDHVFEAAYDAAFAEYETAYDEWVNISAAYGAWEELRDDATQRFFATGQRDPLPDRPTKPGPPPRAPSKDAFARTYYSTTPGSGCSGTGHFGRAAASPTGSRQMVCAGGDGSSSSTRQTTPVHAGGDGSPSSGAGSTAATNRGRSPILTRGDMGSTSSREI